MSLSLECSPLFKHTGARVIVQQLDPWHPKWALEHYQEYLLSAEPEVIFESPDVAPNKQQKQTKATDYILISCKSLLTIPEDSFSSGMRKLSGSSCVRSSGMISVMGASFNFPYLLILSAWGTAASSFLLKIRH